MDNGNKNQMRTNDFLKLWTVNFQFVFASRFVIRIRKTIFGVFRTDISCPTRPLISVDLSWFVCFWGVIQQ